MKNVRSNDMKTARVRIARILSILMILSLFAGGAAFTGAVPDSGYSYAETQADSDFEYTVSGDAATLTAYTGKDAEPVIPVSVGGHRVTAIGPECFRGNVKITTITVPEGITEIGDYAFEACSAATELSLPSTLETIGKGAFSGDAQLKAVVIPGSVHKIDDGAFLYCMKAASITGGEGLTELGQFVFAGCESAKTVNIGGQDLKVIPDRTFCNCVELMNVTLPDSVEIIGKRAFSGCVSLEEISLGRNLKSVVEYAFEDCVALQDLAIDENAEGLALGSNILNLKFTGSVHIKLPDNTQIEDDTFEKAGIAGLHVYGNGKLTLSGGGEQLLDEDGQLYGDGGSTLLRAFSEKYDSASETWQSVTTTFTDGTRTRVRYTVRDSVTAIGPEAFTKKRYANVVLPAGIEELDDKTFRESLIKSVSFSDGDSSGRYFIKEGILYENAEASDGEDDTPSGDDPAYRLVRFFPKKVGEDGNTLSDTTIDIKEDEASILDPEKQFTLPYNVSDIAPYAFYGSEIWLVIPDNTWLTALGDYSFSNSGIKDPREEQFDSSFGGKIDVSQHVLDTLAISDKAFEDAWDYYVDFTDDEYDEMEDPDVPADPDAEGGDIIGRRDRDETSDTEDLDFNDRFARFDENGEMDGSSDDDYVTEDPVVSYTSLSGDKSLYSEKKYGSYKVIPNSGFTDWCEAYLEHNKGEIEFSQELMPYTMLYKGETHYRSMVCVLNHDQFKTQYAITNTGDDFAPMYLMMDHGLEAELMRGEVQEDVVLYSGITVEKMADIAGFEDKSITPTAEQMAEAIGGEFTDLAFMSTTTDPNIAGSFSDHSKTMVVIYASQDSLRRQGAVCLDSFTNWGGGECEILLNPNAKFKILDVGTVTISDSRGNIDYTRTYVRLEMAPYRSFPDNQPEQVKSIGSANVTGIKAKYTYSGKAKKPAPVVELDGKKLVNGTDYTLKYSSNKNVGKAKVVITGKGKYTGTITKTFKIIPKGTSIRKLRKAKKAVRVTWKKQSRKMSKSRITGYQIQVATNSKFTKGKKTVTVKGYKKVSKKISKLKGKKKYYVRIRTYKTVKGTRYYSAWSKAKKVTTRK